MLNNRPTIFIAAPFYGSVHPGSRMGIYEQASCGRNYNILQPAQFSSSALTENFNHHLCAALNHPIEGGVDLFVMLHSDVQPGAGWLDAICDERARLGAAMLSCLIPLKNHEGKTSTGVDTPTGVRRFTMHEAMRLPETFNAELAGYPGQELLANVGCFVLDMRGPWLGTILTPHADGQSGFHIRGGVRQGQDGKWRTWFEPDDWNLSRDVAAGGGKIFVTRKVRCIHYGEQAFGNWEAWGTCLSDTDWRANPSHRPHVYQHIHGWFDFDDVYREAIAAAKDGAHFVEVGSWLGKSAAFMAVEIINSGKVIRFDCVDHWKGNADQPVLRQAASQEDIYQLFCNNMKRFGLAEVVSPIRRSSDEAAYLYPDSSLDFVFIDADHRYEEVKKDISIWLPKVKPGGVLAGHDFDETSDPGVVKAVLEANPNIEVWGRSWVWKKTIPGVGA